MRRLFCFVFLLVSFVSFGQTIMVDGNRLRWEAGLTGGLCIDGWEAEANVALFPTDYIGMKLGLGLASEIEEIGDWGKEEWDKSREYTTRLMVRPALALRSPRLIDWKAKDVQFHLFCEPGFVISPGAAGSRNARIVCWDLRGGFNMQLDNIIVTVGYGVSNFTLYSGCWSGSFSDSNDYLTHTVYAGIGWKF